MLSVELLGYEQALGIFDQKPVKAVAAATLKRVQVGARTIASEEVRKIYNIKKSDLDPRMKLLPPRSDTLTARIDISGRGIGLAYFGARQLAVGKVITRTKKGMKEPRRKSGAFMGVQVSVTAGETTQLRSAFLVRLKSGHIGVMQRIGKKRLPIIEKAVKSLASMLQNSKIEPIVLDKVNERWRVEFPRQLKYFLEKGKENGA